MRTPPLLADFIHHRVCKPKCEKSLTLPDFQRYGAFLAFVLGIKGLVTHQIICDLLLGQILIFPQVSNS